MRFEALRGLREVSLFSGAGGGVLASKLLGWRTLAYVEWDEYCQAILRARIADGFLDDAPIYGDVGTVDGTLFRGEVDIIAAGPPCQAFSLAGKQLADQDGRNRWPDTIRVIREAEPPLAFIENVPGLLAGSHGYFGVLMKDLHDAGYDAVWSCLPAAAVGAPHRRDRLWILAAKRDPGQGSARDVAFVRFAQVAPHGWVVSRAGDASDWGGVTRPFQDMWPRAGILRGGTAYRMEPLADATGHETHSSVLDGMTARNPDSIIAWNNARDSRTSRVALANLRQAVLDHSYQERFPTPRSEDSEQAGAHRGRPDTLTSYTRVHPTSDSFPTPTVYDATGHGSPRAEQREGNKHAVSLYHLAASWTAPTSSVVTVGDMEQARFAGNYGEAIQAWPNPTRKHADWPTPRANERQQHNSADRHMALSAAVLNPSWPTPTSADGRGGPGNAGREGGMNLRTAVTEWATPTATINRKSRRAMTASKDNGRRSGGGQSSPPALEQMVEIAEGLLPKELEGVALSDLPPATLALFDAQWPTPRARDWKGSDHARDRNESGSRHAGDDLATAVEKRAMWPTPLAGNPDPRSGGNHGGMALLQAARSESKSMWPTPMAGSTDVRDGGGPGGVALAQAATEAEFGSPTASMKIRSGNFSEGRTPNPAEVAYQESGQRGQLNPDWVEWLMGWPVGWTSTDPMWEGGFCEWQAKTDHLVWWRQEPADIPRIAVGIPNRVSRLKAIGNGQVSLCAAAACDALYELLLRVEAAFEADAPPELDILAL